MLAEIFTASENFKIDKKQITYEGDGISMKYVIGIDVGTTGTKAILFSKAGERIAHAYRSYPLYNPTIGASEQNAEDWWHAVCETVREVVSDKDVSANVAAISLSTQGGTVVLTDEEGSPLRHAIVWNDSRFEVEREKYLREIGDEQSLYLKTGWKLGKGRPLLAVRYLRDNAPELFNHIRRVLTVPSYISLKMTGRAATDLSNAGIDEFCDIANKKYDDKLIDFAGIKKEYLAEIVPSGEVIGNLTAEAARALGLTEKTVLVSGAHDQYAVSLGAGATNPGDIIIGSGTCWVVTALGDEFDFDSGFAQSVSAVDGLFGTLRSLSTGGVCLEWLRNNVARRNDTDDPIDYKTLDAVTAELRACEDGLFFFPFRGIYGGKNGFNKAAFVGMDLSHNRYHLARAVMEGVVFQILWMMEDFKTKPSKEGIKLTGGASRSPVWCKFLADVSGLPVIIPDVADLGCVGAAVLAGVGAGIYSSAKEGHAMFSVNERVLLPDPRMTEIYKPIFEKYKNTARALGASY